MVKVAPRDAAGFLRTPPAAIRAVLLTGNDVGLIRERAQLLVRHVVPNGDPLSIVQLTGAQIAEEPARLVDEANQISMFGGRRAIRVTAATDRLAEPLKAFLAQDGSGAGDALVVIEAPELRAGALQRLCDAAANAATLTSYGGDERALEGLVQQSLREANLRAGQDVVQAIVTRLGADWQLARREVEKLILYCGPDAREVTLADCDAALGDAAASTLDDIAYAVADANLADLDDALGRCFNGGEHPVTVVRAVQRHFHTLHQGALKVADGAPAMTVAKGLRVFWKREAAFVRQMQRWPAGLVLNAIERLGAAEIACKSTGLPAEAALRHALNAVSGLVMLQRTR
jgi:DNA polymerase-3 subunit delta